MEKSKGGRPEKTPDTMTGVARLSDIDISKAVFKAVFEARIEPDVREMVASQLATGL